MDNRGNITLEITLLIVVILMVMGVLLSGMDNTTDKIIKDSEKHHLDLMTSEVVDNLINNPGNPDTWNELGFGTPGLAIVNEEGETVPNSISWAKFIALEDNYKKLVFEKLFDSKLKTSMELIPQESSISSVKIGQYEDSNTVTSVNRLVKCDFYKKYVVKDFLNDGKCNRNHNQKDHICNYFKVFKSNLRSSDYYLLIDNNEKDLKYFIDTTRVVKEKYWENIPSHEIYLNNQIEFYDDNNAIVFIHFDKIKTKAVLVSVPKNFDRNNLNYDYFRTNNCEFILKAWY